MDTTDYVSFSYQLMAFGHVAVLLVLAFTLAWATYYLREARRSVTVYHVKPPETRRQVETRARQHFRSRAELRGPRGSGTGIGKCHGK